MNSTFKIRLRIINFISIFSLLLIFSCNLKQKTEDNPEECNQPKKEKAKNFYISSEDLQRRIQRDLFEIPEKDIKTIIERYKEKPFNKISYSLYPVNSEVTYQVKDANGLPQTYSYSGIGEDGERFSGTIKEDYHLNQIFLDFFFSFLLEDIHDGSKIFKVSLNNEDLFPRPLTKDDIPKLKGIIPKLKEILNKK